MRSSLLAVTIAALALFPLLASADVSQCAPPTNPSQYCMGSDGPVVVGKNTLPMCIPGCTYTVSDVSSGKEISASFTADACDQYQSYVAHQGKVAPCDPGDDSQNVIPSVDGSWAGTSNAQMGTNASGEPATPTARTTTVQRSAEQPAAPAIQSPPEASAMQQSTCDPNGILSLLTLSCAGQATGSLPDAGAPDTGPQQMPSLDSLIPIQSADPNAQVAPAPQELSPPLPQGDAAPIDVPPPQQPAQEYSNTNDDVKAPAVVTAGSPGAPMKQNWAEELMQSIFNLFAPPRRSSMSDERYTAAAIEFTASTQGQSAKCDGGTVFVYSKDFSNMSDNVDRPAQVGAIQCYRPSYLGSTIDWYPLASPFRRMGANTLAPLSFKEGKELTLQNGCQWLPEGSMCAVIYAAATPNSSRGPTIQACSPQFVQRGSAVQFSMCSGTETKIRDQYARASQSRLHQIITTVTQGQGPGWGIGQGWSITPYYNGILYSDNGTTPGYNNNNYAPYSGVPTGQTPVVNNFTGLQFTTRF